MKIAVWQTNHEISQTVSKALAKGFDADLLSTAESGPEQIAAYDVHIAYGILRGCADVFRLCDTMGKPWFNVDRGYFNPSHYDGYYRLSFRGTQAKWHANGPKREHSLELLPLRAGGEYALVCPPSEYVCEFFDIRGHMNRPDVDEWLLRNVPICPYVRRDKSEQMPIEWGNLSKIVTFNSTVAIEALRRGIPVISDPQHSVVGSYQAAKSVDTWDRDELFNFMRAHDFTLAELERGQALPLLEHYLSM